MIIKNIDINSYKGISKLKFNPKKINIIVGKNNTGKTSVLEAINLVFHNRDIKLREASSYFNIYSDKENINISVGMDGKEEKIEIRKATGIEVVNTFSKDLIKSFLKHLTRRSKVEFKKSFIEELEKIVEKYIDNELKDFLLKNALVILDKKNEGLVYYELHDYFIFEKIENLIENISNHILERLIPPSQRDEYKKHLKYASEYTLYSARGLFDKGEVLREKNQVIYIDSPITEIRRMSISKRKPEDSERLHIIEEIVKKNNLIGNLEGLSFDNVLFSTEEGIKAHSFNFLGDGFKSIIGLLWQFSSKKMNDSVILLDEPETHMHPGYIRELIKFIIEFSKKMNIQFFITTHSLDVLEIILSEDLEKDEKYYIEKELRILRMDKVKETTTIAECIDYNEAKETKDELLLDLRGV